MTVPSECGKIIRSIINTKYMVLPRVTLVCCQYPTLTALRIPTAFIVTKSLQTFIESIAEVGNREDYSSQRKNVICNVAFSTKMQFIQYHMNDDWRHFPAYKLQSSFLQICDVKLSYFPKFNVQFGFGLSFVTASVSLAFVEGYVFQAEIGDGAWHHPGISSSVLLHLQFHDLVETFGGLCVGIAVEVGFTFNPIEFLASWTSSFGFQRKVLLRDHAQVFRWEGFASVGTVEMSVVLHHAGERIPATVRFAS